MALPVVDVERQTVQGPPAPLTAPVGGNEELASLGIGKTTS
jgi:hypothetical protein